ncbi:MAG: energy-coupling factor transporter transmembrane protein EcfT [Proteobacteria bacterium]|nr:energy-coupling factor transporter transmembrane protein EcfT [Pseudomonadota bacterium]
MLNQSISHDTWLHRVPASFKLLALALCGTALALVQDWRWLAAGFALASVTYASMGKLAWQQARHLRPIAWVAVMIAAFHAWQGTPELGVASALRLMTGLLLASLLTLSTRFDDLLDVLEKVLRPLGCVGVPTARLALALALVLRFVAVFHQRWQRLDDAHRARTGRPGGLRLIAPLTIRALQTAEHVADALAARLDR